MAVWEQAPREQYQRVEEYIVAKYGKDPHNIVLDAERRIIKLELPKVSKKEMAALIEELQSRFPHAF